MFSSGQEHYDDFIKIFNNVFNNNLTKESRFKKMQELWNEVKSGNESLSNLVKLLGSEGHNETQELFRKCLDKSSDIFTGKQNTTNRKQYIFLYK